MKTFFLSICLFFVSTDSLFSQTNWELLNPTPSYKTGFNIKFVSPQHGYILNSGELLETINSGFSWSKKQDITSGVEMTFKNSVGFIVGNNGYILKSIDGGNNWTQVSTGFNTNFTSVSIIDENTIFISSNQTFFKSTDGGLTWQMFIFPTSYVNKTVFLNNLVGHAVTGDGKILKTVNGGLNWYVTQTTSSSPSGYFSIYFINDNVGFATQQFNNMYKTTNGGETWSQVTGTFQAIYSVCFVDENTGYASGELGALYKTTNGGTTWSSANFEPGFYYAKDLYSIFFTDVNTGYAVGLRGRILKTNNGAASWSEYSPTYDDVKQLGFTNPNTGYALVDNTFFKTGDGGQTWANIGPPEAGAQTVGFDFVNETTAFAVGGGSVGTSADVKKNIQNN